LPVTQRSATAIPQQEAARASSPLLCNAIRICQREQPPTRIEVDRLGRVTVATTGATKPAQLSLPLTRFREHFTRGVAIEPVSKRCDRIRMIPLLEREQCLRTQPEIGIGRSRVRVHNVTLPQQRRDVRGEHPLSVASPDEQHVRESRMRSQLGHSPPMFCCTASLIERPKMRE
jgi:hypothetical protein